MLRHRNFLAQHLSPYGGKTAADLGVSSTIQYGKELRPLQKQNLPLSSSGEQLE